MDWIWTELQDWTGLKTAVCRQQMQPRLQQVVSSSASIINTGLLSQAGSEGAWDPTDYIKASPSLSVNIANTRLLQIQCASIGTIVSCDDVQFQCKAPSKQATDYKFRTGWVPSSSSLCCLLTCSSPFWDHFTCESYYFFSGFCLHGEECQQVYMWCGLSVKISSGSTMDLKQARRLVQHGVTLMIDRQ